jgi:hypothetical protein
MYKTLIPLLLAIAASAAFAAEKVSDGKPMPTPAPNVVEQAEPAPARSHTRKHRRLPRGDLRACLDLKDNAAIIKCAETRP